MNHEIQKEIKEAVRQFTSEDVENAKPVEPPKGFVVEDGKMKLKRKGYKVEALQKRELTDAEKLKMKKYWDDVYGEKKIEYKSVNQFKFELIEQYKPLDIVDSFKPLANAIAHYVARSEEFIELANKLNCQTEPSLEKGILIVGDYGIGKSVFMQTVNETCKPKLEKEKSGKSKYTQYENPIVGRYVSSISLVKKSQDDESEVFKEYSTGGLIIDDLGADKDTKFFGRDGSELIGAILEERYLNKLKTHATTNFSHDEMQDIYGKRLFERFYEMFNIFPVTGENLRR